MSVEFIKLLRDNMMAAVARLNEMAQYRDNPLYSEALCSRFRLCFECIRHLLVQYLTDYEGIPRSDFARQIYEIAMQKRLIPDSTIWMEMMSERNQLVHECSFPDLMAISRQIELRYTDVINMSAKTLNAAIDQIKSN